MDFIVSFNDHEERFVQFDDVINFLKAELAYWNNFEDITKEPKITIRRVRSDTPTLAVRTNEEINTADLFGQG